MNLGLAFVDSASRHRQKPALFWGELELNYDALLTRASFVSQLLRDRFGVRPGDRVALWLKNCPEFVPALFGTLMTGAVVVPINNFLKPDEVLYMLNDAGIDTLITDIELAPAAAQLQGRRATLKVWDVQELETAPAKVETNPNRDRGEKDLAVIIYTSGTTGRPKGAMLSHGNLLHNVDSCRQVLQAVGEDRFVILLPMFHSFMLTVGILLPLLVGGSLVVVKSLHPPKNIVAEIMQRQATILPAVPQLFRMLMHPSVPVQLPLRICISGGAPLPGEILKEFTQKFPIPLLEGYGLSESSPVATFNPIQGPWKAGSIGVPIPNVEVSIQNDAGAILEAGETGEVCIRGGNVMMGYWNQPEETAKSLRNGWLLTGDIGHRDADGYFFITDRKKDMLLVNGINVYPREIEEVLYQFPGVKEAAVIGQPDARKGEQAIAFIAAAEGVTLDEKAILGFVRERLADYKVPRQIHFLPALPRNATGKILKTALRELKSPPGASG